MCVHTAVSIHLIVMFTSHVGHEGLGAIIKGIYGHWEYIIENSYPPNKYGHNLGTVPWYIMGIQASLILLMLLAIKSDLQSLFLDRESEGRHILGTMPSPVT